MRLEHIVKIEHFTQQHIAHGIDNSIYMLIFSAWDIITSLDGSLILGGSMITWNMFRNASTVLFPK